MRSALSATAALASGNSRLWAFARFNVAFLTARRRARSSFTFALFVRTASSNSDLQYCNVSVGRLMQRSTSFLRESSLSMRYFSSTSSCSRERTGRGLGRSGSMIVNIGSYIGFGWTSSQYLFSHGSFAFPIPFAFFISGPDDFFFIIIVTLH